MKVTLVQPPVLHTIRESLNPPLGLLTLGTALRDDDADVELVDLNLRGFQDETFRDPATFYAAATDAIAATAPDVVGFTSMAMDSHVALELAKRLRERDAGVRTVFGGAHFTSIATEVLDLYPWTDFVVTGAGEQAIVDLARHLRGRGPAERLVNIAHRTTTGVRLQRQPVRPTTLDSLPAPAYELVDLDQYFAVNPVSLVCVEHARGCQLRCAFCYSEAHWGHGETARSIDPVVEELARVAKLGARTVFFVADNFVTSPRFARELCGAIEQARLGLGWTCYATLAQLGRETVNAMARAGCTSVFVGVDAVSDTNRKEFRKTYFKGWEPLRETLQHCIDHGVDPTCSFMLSSADTTDGIELTLRTALLARATGAEVYLNPLSIYGSTALDQSGHRPAPEYTPWKAALLYDAPPVTRENFYARVRPDLYPMHQATPGNGEIADLVCFAYTARALMDPWRVTLTRYVLDADGSLVDLIEPKARRVAEVLDDPLSVNISGLRTLVDSELLETVEGYPWLSGVIVYDRMRATTGPEDALVPIVIRVNGSLRSVHANPFKAVSLPAAPEHLAATRPLRSRDPNQRFLLTRHGDGIFGYACGPGTPEPLQEGYDEALATETLTMSFDTYTELKRQRVLLP